MKNSRVAVWLSALSSCLAVLGLACSSSGSGDAANANSAADANASTNTAKANANSNANKPAPKPVKPVLLGMFLIDVVATEKKRGTLTEAMKTGLADTRYFFSAKQMVVIAPKTETIVMGITPVAETANSVDLEALNADGSKVVYTFTSDGEWIWMAGKDGSQPTAIRMVTNSKTDATRSWDLLGKFKVDADTYAWRRGGLSDRTRLLLKSTVYLFANGTTFTKVENEDTTSIEYKVITKTDDEITIESTNETGPKLQWVARKIGAHIWFGPKDRPTFEHVPLVATAR